MLIAHGGRICERNRNSGFRLQIHNVQHLLQAGPDDVDLISVLRSAGTFVFRYNWNPSVFAWSRLVVLERSCNFLMYVGKIEVSQGIGKVSR